MYSLAALTGQTWAHAPQPVHFARSIKRGAWLSVALNRPGPPSRDSTFEWVTMLIFRCRPTSTSLGEMTHIAQSLVGNVLSNCDIKPPTVGDWSTR